jgi:hypothetical protein
MTYHTGVTGKTAGREKGQEKGRPAGRPSISASRRLVRHARLRVRREGLILHRAMKLIDAASVQTFEIAERIVVCMGSIDHIHSTATRCPPAIL